MQGAQKSADFPDLETHKAYPFPSGSSSQSFSTSPRINQLTMAPMTQVVLLEPKADTSIEQIETVRLPRALRDAIFTDSIRS